jgi:hypothetical protein
MRGLLQRFRARIVRALEENARAASVLLERTAAPIRCRGNGRNGSCPGGHRPVYVWNGKSWQRETLEFRE